MLTVRLPFYCNIQTNSSNRLIHFTYSSKIFGVTVVEKSNSVTGKERMDSRPLNPFFSTVVHRGPSRIGDDESTSRLGLTLLRRPSSPHISDDMRSVGGKFGGYRGTTGVYGSGSG